MVAKAPDPLLIVLQYSTTNITAQAVKQLKPDFFLELLFSAIHGSGPVGGLVGQSVSQSVSQSVHRFDPD